MTIIQKELIYHRPIRTSRGEMAHHRVWYLSDIFENKRLLGECAPLPGLSVDFENGLDSKLKVLSEETHDIHELVNSEDFNDCPALRFALDQIKVQLENEGFPRLFDNEWSKGHASIRINGLIWMGDLAFLKEQIKAKLQAGQHCLKLKIASLEWKEEIGLLRAIRQEYSSSDLQLRVDANGGFHYSDTKERLEELAELQIHSIEQPTPPGNFEQMAELCAESNIDIALDEELIGVKDLRSRKKLLDEIKPQYLILKPTLLGGFQSCELWIKLAEERNIGWWITSALESDIGLNAIAQWTYERTKGNGIQGLGTGSLYRNNIPSPLHIEGDILSYRTDREWDLNVIYQS